MLFLKNNWHWILFSIVIFGGIGVLIFTQLNTDTEPKIVLGQATKDLLNNRAKQQSPAAVVDTPAVPSTEEHPPEPHVHTDGTVHLPTPPTEVSPALFDRLATFDGIVLSPKSISFAKAPAGVDLNWASMTPEEVTKAIDDIENGRHFPPPGYEYLWDPDDTSQLALDLNGFPILHTRGEPKFFYDPTIGFRPSSEQLKEYKRLQAAHTKAILSSDQREEAQRLSEKLRYMRYNIQGKKPGYSISLDREAESMEEFLEIKRTVMQTARPIRRQLTADAFRKVGLGYLIEELLPPQ